MFSRGHRASRRIGRVDGPRWRPVRSGRGQEQSMEWVVWVLVGAALLLVGAAGLFPGAAPAQLIRPPPLAEATRPQFADLARVLPDIGRFDPNPWGLTFEIRDHEQPHWTGQRNSPATFGHFGDRGLLVPGGRTGDGRPHRPGLRALGPGGPAQLLRRGAGTLRSVPSG